MKKNFSTTFVRLFIGFAVTAIVSVLLFKTPLPLDLMEDKLYDFRFKVRGVVKPPDSIIIAAIDEKSLAKLGRWPWGRDVMARLVDKLAKAEAAVIAFDVIFPEAEKNDPLLAKSISDAGNVILPMAFDFEQKSTPLPDPILESSALISIENADLFRNYQPIMSGGVLTVPVQRLRESAMSLAHINMLPDADGTLRWEALLLGHNGLLYPSLGLRCAALFLGIPAENLTVKATQSVNAGKIVIPTDHWGRMAINFFGPGKTFRHVSASDILDGNIESDALANRIVFIGATALGIYDLRVTPYSAVMPGVEKHASVTASILENRFIHKVSPLQNLTFLCCTGIILTLILSRLRLVLGFLVSSAALVCIAISGYIFFDTAGLWVNMACPLGNVMLIFMSVTAWNYTSEERYARQIRAMFSSYVTQTIVNELIKNPDMARLGGEKREVTVLFSDIRGFTTFSEQHTPEEVVALLNEYLGAMTDVILKWEGTLDKFIGDAIVVFWNAPQRHANHPEMALLCAVDMIRRLDQLHEKWSREGKPALSCGIGINTGEVVVGNIGAEGKKMDYTVIGDHVNLGARVESLTRKFDTDILMTEMTLDKLRGAIESRTLTGMEITGLRRVIVKGKEQPVTVYSVKPLTVGVPAVFAECTDLEPIKLTEK